MGNKDDVKSVMVRVPKGMHKEIKELVKQGKYRSVADFFYIAGQKELERVREEEHARLQLAEVEAK